VLLALSFPFQLHLYQCLSLCLYCFVFWINKSLMCCRLTLTRWRATLSVLTWSKVLIQARSSQHSDVYRLWWTRTPTHDSSRPISTTICYSRPQPPRHSQLIDWLIDPLDPSSVSCGGGAGTGCGRGFSPWLRPGCHSRQLSEGDPWRTAPHQALSKPACVWRHRYIWRHSRGHAHLWSPRWRHTVTKRWSVDRSIYSLALAV